MYTLAIVLSFFSVWSLFAITEKVEFNKKRLTLALSENVGLAKVVSFLSFLTATILLGSLLGPAVGILANTVIWMIFASCIVLFAPFPKLRLPHLVLIIVVLLGLEVVFNLFL